MEDSWVAKEEGSAYTRGSMVRTKLQAAFPHLVRYGLLLLPLSVVLTFIVIPLVRTVWESFLAINARGLATGPAGLKNYRELFASHLFRLVLRNTLLYAVLSVILCLVIAFFLSLLLNQKRNFSSRPLLIGLFSPTVIPMIAAASVWQYFLAPRFGLVDRMLSFLGLGHENWLGHPGTALGVLVLLFVWKYAPYFTLFLLAGLQSIPPEVREALRTEDPHHLYSFRKVILPVIAPMISFVTVMSVVYALETVDPVYVLTQGGPNNGTNLIMYYLYNLGFNYFSWGMAAALSTLLMAGLSALSAFALITLERRTFHWQ
ncbi:lactose transport system permease protein LacF [Peptococcaceae bacterium CEB3]|nr:lactose transport system permease protein LacF [Peptococcaceae bacterium CEB3]